MTLGFAESKVWSAEGRRGCGSEANLDVQK